MHPCTLWGSFSILFLSLNCTSIGMLCFRCVCAHMCICVLHAYWHLLILVCFSFAQVGWAPVSTRTSDEKHSSAYVPNWKGNSSADGDDQGGIRVEAQVTFCIHSYQLHPTSFPNICPFSFSFIYMLTSGSWGMTKIAFWCFSLF